MKYMSFSASDVGIKRTNNEDAFGYCETNAGNLFIVCDGMGGHAAGEQASNIAVSTIQNYFKEFQNDNIVEALNDAIQHANKNIRDEAQNNPDFSGMGTTCVVVFIHESGDIYIGHVGDSRCYLLNENNELSVLTKDHSYVQFLIETGDISTEDAFDHTAKNRILKALGIEPNVSPTITQEPYNFGANNTLILCTDGLNDMLRDEEIREILVTSTLPEEQINKLIQEALNKGGKDNITITIIRITESPFGEINASVPPKQKIKLKSFQLVLIILILALLSLYLYPFIKGKRNDSNMPENEHQLNRDTISEPNDKRSTDLRLDSSKSEITPKGDISQIKPNENVLNSNALTKDSIITEVKYESSVIDSTNTEE